MFVDAIYFQRNDADCSVVMRRCIQLGLAPEMQRIRGEVLSFKPGAAVRHSRFLLTETLPRVFLSACLTALSQARRAEGCFCLSRTVTDVTRAFDRRAGDFL